MGGTGNRGVVLEKIRRLLCGAAAIARPGILACRRFMWLSMLVACAGTPLSGKQEGMEAYQRQDFAAAYEKLLPLAEGGDTEAQFLLGEMYRQGQGVRQDYRQAVAWHRKAAEHGNGAAQYFMGNLYVNGGGIVEKDYRQAEFWYRKSIGNDNADAMYGLGYLYEKGFGVPNDLVEAYKWFSLAALKGNTKAGKKREQIRELMTPEQIEMAKGRVR